VGLENAVAFLLWCESRCARNFVSLLFFSSSFLAPYAVRGMCVDLETTGAILGCESRSALFFVFLVAVYILLSLRARARLGRWPRNGGRLFRVRVKVGAVFVVLLSLLFFCLRSLCTCRGVGVGLETAGAHATAPATRRPVARRGDARTAAAWVVAAAARGANAA
jgi:hypothetical protein